MHTIYTAGPWRPGCSDNLNWEVNGPDGGIYDVWSGLVPDNGKANARLIAQAPTMLQDLTDAAAQLRKLGGEVNAALAARFEATIAAAVGGVK